MSPIDYQDFELKIELIPGTDNRYRVDVINSPSGQAKGEFDLPFSDQELDSLRDTGLPTLETVQEFGRTLFDLVFANKIEICLRRSLDAVHRENERLRLRLCLTDAPALAELPWEYLYDTSQNRFLVQFTNTPVVRSLSLPRPISSLTVQLPLRMLVMIANPNDHNFGQLNAEDEWSKIQAALGPLQERKLLTVTRLEAATLSVLQRELRRSHYHIFHYIGHGSFDRVTNESGLLLEDEYRKSQLVTSRKLATLLCDHPSLRLIMLNACSGARIVSGVPFVSLAQHLMEQGVPAVIAMQFDIIDAAAITFAQEFYAALADNYPIEAALAEARKRIYSNGNDVEWGTPVLYLHAKNGQIFNITNQYQTNQLEQYQTPELQLQLLLNEYTKWHRNQNKRFQQLLLDGMVSRAAFKQALNVADSQVKLVERQTLWATLDTWFAGWHKNKIFILLGEEGDGKTWGVAAWLNQKISIDATFPPVVFLSSVDVAANNPRELLLQAINPHDVSTSLDDWQQLVAKWFVQPSIVRQR